MRARALLSTGSNSKRKENGRGEKSGAVNMYAKSSVGHAYASTSQALSLYPREEELLENSKEGVSSKAPEGFHTKTKGGVTTFEAANPNPILPEEDGDHAIPVLPTCMFDLIVQDRTPTGNIH